MLYDLLYRTRTIRRFSRDVIPSREELEKCVKCARVTPSTANRQRLRFAFILGEHADEAFSSVAFAGYLPECERPSYEDRAGSYMVILSDMQTPDVHVSIDIGIASEAIVLAAREAGYGACIIRSFKQTQINSLVGAPEGLYANLVIAIGRDNENADIVDMKDGDIKYYRDNATNTNFVPKRTVEELIVN